MGKNLKYIFAAGFVGACMLAFTGCGDEGCTEATTSYTVASLVPVAGTSPVPPKSVSVYGIGQKEDSVMIQNSTSFKSLALLLNPDTTCTKMLFEFPVSETDTLRDTLSFYYKNQVYFLTIDCGCTVQNYLDSVLHTNHLIKNLEIVNPEVKNEKTQNITLYY
ncbi:MAG: DUF6452 family protein [Bacteroidales bacterium]